MKRAALYYGAFGLLLISTSALGQSAPSAAPAPAQNAAGPRPAADPSLSLVPTGGSSDLRLAQVQPAPMPGTPSMNPQYQQYGPAPQPGQEPVRRPRMDPGPFREGRIEVNGQLGTAWGNSRDYLILGVGAGYYVIDGLRLGLQTQLWFFDSPVIWTLTPEATYSMYFVPVVKPYVGAFFRGYVAGSNFDDTTSIGGRFGVNLPIEMRHAYVGLGGVYEHFLSCSAFRPCDTLYPEVVAALAF